MTIAITMTNNTSSKSKDIIIRTTEYSILVLRLLKKIKVTIYNDNIIRQLLISSSSIGANYCEARETTTKKDFYNKVNISKKEAKETMYWLDLLHADQTDIEEISSLRQEAYEFVRIFASMLPD